jgi:hypothetical protein
MDRRPMQSSVVFRVLRGLIYRTGWVLLYVCHLVLAFFALAMFFGAVIQVIDPNGGESSGAGHKVSVMQRCVVGLLCLLLGSLLCVGSVKLRRWHQSINLFYPELQIGSFKNHEEDERSTELDGGMYDRDIDGLR